MKVILALSVFVAGALAQYHEPAPYAPAPAPYHPPAPYHDEKLPAHPYAYEYGSVDASGLAASKTESQGPDGTVSGSYRTQLPDGRTQIVTYHADHETGYKAEVTYEGEAIPYVAPPAPAYKPAPLLHRPYARQ